MLAILEQVFGTSQASVLFFFIYRGHLDSKVHFCRIFLGIDYCSAHKKASKNPQFEDMFLRRYFRCHLMRGDLGVNRY